MEINQLKEKARLLKEHLKDTDALESSVSLKKQFNDISNSYNILKTEY